MKFWRGVSPLSERERDSKIPPFFLGGGCSSLGESEEFINFGNSSETFQRSGGGEEEEGRKLVVGES